MFTIGASAILFDDRHRVLLCHRRDMDAWNLPGGGVVSGELPTEAVIRETKEETGLEVAVERTVGIYGKADKDELVFAFVCSVIDGELSTTDESDQCEYFGIEELPVNTLPKHVERIQDALDISRGLIFRRQTAPSAREMLTQWVLAGKSCAVDQDVSFPSLTGPK
jgi:8-oxo-dGTP diphosphatase